MSSRLTFESSYNKEVSVAVYCDTDERDGHKYLIAYADGDMQDGFDYEEYEARINAGEDFESIAQEIVDELEASDY